MTIKGRPVNSQCAKILAEMRQGRDRGSIEAVRAFHFENQPEIAYRERAG